MIDSTNNTLLMFMREVGVPSYWPELVVSYHLIDDTMERININNIAKPYPDGPGAPVFMNNQWYSYIQSMKDVANAKAENYVVAINDADGLATGTKTNISNYLLRVPANGTPTPLASGTPYPVFSAPHYQYDPITPTPGDWYNRMAAI
jgi:hypothetical protein